MWAVDPNADRNGVNALYYAALRLRIATRDRYGVLQSLGLLAYVLCSADDTSDLGYIRAAVLLGLQDRMQDRKELPIPALNANAIAFAKAVVAQKVSPSAYLPAAFAAASSSATRAPCNVLPSE